MTKRGVSIASGRLDVAGNFRSAPLVDTARDEARWVPGRDNCRELRTHGSSLAIASFLLPHERRELAHTLRRPRPVLTQPPA